MLRPINGILLLDKPFNITSNAALQKIKRLFNAKKAGHTGSLDPIATGMLPICFGEATKFSQFLLDSDKSYRVEAKLGIQTSTGDAEGEIINTKSVQGITAAHVEKVMNKFLGEIEQIPPMFSAIKYKGKPLYQLARKGIEVDRVPRRIKIFSLKFESLVDEVITFSVQCSKGTYIRTLVEDIGKELGCGGYVTALRRLGVSAYKDSVIYTLPILETIAEEGGINHLLSCLLPMETAVQQFPAVQLSASAAFYLRTGQSIRPTLPITAPLVRLLNEDRFIGMGEVLPDGRIKAQRLIA